MSPADGAAAATDVAIVGGGVLGCAIALELRRRGASALVIDKNGDVGQGSTAASCGIVRRFYSTPTMTAMAEEGARIFADWRGHLGVEDELGMARFERPGMLFVPPALDARVLGIVQQMNAIGIAAEVLTAEQVRERFPYLDVTSQSPVRDPADPAFFASSGRPIAGAVFEPGAGYVVSPHVAAKNLRAAGVALGARFLLGRRVTAIARRRDGFAVGLDDGSSLRAAAVVNAAGPHSGLVNRLAGVELPIETRPLRRETHAVRNPTFVAPRGSPLPVVGDVDSGIYFRPESHGRDIIVGSLDPECDAMLWQDDPDALDPQVTAPCFERQVMRLMKRVEGVTLGPRRGVVGLYDVTPLDWNPVLDRTDLPGYYVAIGTSGSSFKTSPVIGFVMAELILACEGGRDHDREPLSVRLPRTGIEVGLGFFSRRRGAIRSSGTVLG